MQHPAIRALVRPVAKVTAQGHAYSAAARTYGGRRNRAERSVDAFRRCDCRALHCRQAGHEGGRVQAGIRDDRLLDAELGLLRLLALHRARNLVFFGDLAGLAEADTFAAWLAPFCKSEWVVYAKPPFDGPEAVLAYLSRYTHRVAISNNRLISADAKTVTFRWKDYRIKNGDRRKVMQLATDEFIRRFLIHVLPDGFHRIRHYGFLASAGRKAAIAKIRTVLTTETAKQDDPPSAEIVPLTLREPCPACGGPMRIIEIFRRGQKPRSRAPPREQAA